MVSQVSRYLMNPSDYALITEAARLCKTSRARLVQAIESGWLTAHRTAGGTELVLVSSVKDYLRYPPTRGRPKGNAK
jgi:hypothetical protein